MSLNFIYGRAKANLAKECIRRIQLDTEDKNTDKILILAPEEYKKEIEIEIRSSNAIDSDLKIDIRTIKELCASTISNYGSRQLKALNEEQKQVILTHILNHENTELSMYGHLSTDKRFIELLGNSITKLKESRITATSLSETIKKIDNILTQKKLEDINTIYNKYEDFIKDKFLDEQDKIIYAEKLIQMHHTEMSLSIYTYKLDNITPIEFELLKSLTSFNTNVTAVLISDNINRNAGNSSGAFFNADEFVSKLKEHHIKNHIEIKDEILIESEFQSKEINHLEENLFKYPYLEFNTKTEDIILKECITIQDEIKNLIKNIEILRNNGEELSSITIAITDLNTYERAFKTLFDKYNIPFTFKNSESLSQHPLFRVIEILLESKKELTKGNFVRLIKTGYMQIDLINTNILEKYLKTQDNNHLFVSENINDIELSGLKFNCNEELKTLINNLEILFNNWETAKNFTDFYKSLFVFFENINALQEIKDSVNKELELNGDSNTLAVWDHFIRRMDSNSRLLDTEEISFETFKIVLTNIIDNASKDSTVGSNGIKVIPVNQLKDNANDFVFIIGANEGLLPAKLNSNTLFTDKDILEFNALGLLQGEDTISKVLSEQFSIYKYLTSAKRLIGISYPVTGNDLAVMKKSPIISRLNQLFSDISKNVPEWDNMCLDGIINKKYNINTFERLEEVITKTIDLSDKEKDIVLERLEELKDIPLYEDYIKNAVQAIKYDNKAKCEDKYTLQSLYYSDTLSVSKLEKYAKCPFSYFAEYGLKAKEEEKTTLQAKDIGIAIHSIIEQFGIRLKKNNLEWEGLDDQYIANEVNSIMSYIEKRTEMQVFNSNEASKYYKVKLKQLAITSIKTLKFHIGNSFFKTIGHEINFDDKGQFPPITIKLPSGKRIKLRGQIDRLDELNMSNGKYIRIVDYKTGNTTLDFTEILHGTQLQLLTYLDAIVNSNKEEYTPAGVFYFKVDDPYIKANPNIDDTYILENKLKEMRMKGLFVNNGNLVQFMDKGIYDGEYKTSLNVQAKFKTDGNLSKSTPGIALNELEVLREYTKEITKELAQRMLVEGDIEILPIKKKSIEACTYCSYKSICQFDESLSFNEYKHLVEVDKDEVLNIAQKKVSGNNE